MICSAANLSRMPRGVNPGARVSFVPALALHEDQKQHEDMGFDAFFLLMKD
jgi:hypothetical protein